MSISFLTVTEFFKNSSGHTPFLLSKVTSVVNVHLMPYAYVKPSMRKLETCKNLFSIIKKLVLQMLRQGGHSN